MRAMVLAAGLGTRLRPITYEIAKPMVPVLDRPVMAHIVDLLGRSGVEEIIANLHHFPDPIRDYFGDRVNLHERSHGWGSHVIEFFAIGTAIIPSEGSEDHVIPAPQPVLDLS